MSENSISPSSSHFPSSPPPWPSSSQDHHHHDQENDQHHLHASPVETPLQNKWKAIALRTIQVEHLISPTSATFLESFIQQNPSPQSAPALRNLHDEFDEDFYRAPSGDSDGGYESIEGGNDGMYVKALMLYATRQGWVVPVCEYHAVLRRFDRLEAQLGEFRQRIADLREREVQVNRREGEIAAAFDAINREAFQLARVKARVEERERFLQGGGGWQGGTGLDRQPPPVPEGGRIPTFSVLAPELPYQTPGESSSAMEVDRSPQLHYRRSLKRLRSESNLNQDPEY